MYVSSTFFLQTPRTPIERHKVQIPTGTPLTQQASAPPAAFDFGAVLRMQAVERAQAQRKDPHVTDALLKKEQGDSSSDTNSVELKRINKITVAIESTDQPLIQDSSV